MQVRDYKRLVSRLLRRNISKPLCAIPHDVERPLSCHEWCAFLFAPHCRIQDRKVTETGNPCSGDRCAKRLSGRFFRMYATSWINYLAVSLVGDEYRCGCYRYGIVGLYCRMEFWKSRLSICNWRFYEEKEIERKKDLVQNARINYFRRLKNNEENVIYRWRQRWNIVYLPKYRRIVQ